MEQKEHFHNNITKTHDAWNKYQALGQRIKVAILDSGIGNHPILKPLKHYKINNGTLVLSENPNIDWDHGTSIAGLIGGGKIELNEEGAGKILGVAPECKIIDCQIVISKSTDVNPGLVVLAINNAIKEGVKVINCSYTFERNDTVIAAIDKALKAGIIFCCPVQNDGQLEFPASLDRSGMLVVEAIPKDGSFNGASVSAAVDIYVPIGKIYTIAANKNDYVSDFGGTSAATAFVSGVAALVLSANQDLTNIEVANIIKNSGTKDNGKSILDASAAVEMALSWNTSSPKAT